MNGTKQRTIVKPPSGGFTFDKKSEDSKLGPDSQFQEQSMNSSGFRIPKGHRGQLSGNGHQRHDTEPELPVVQGSEPEKAPVGTVAMVMLILGLIGSVVYLAAR